MNGGNAMERYLDTSLSARERAEDLLGKLSLDEKMGQVNCLFPYNDNWEIIEKEAEHGIGEVSTLDVREIESLDEAVQWQRKIQKMVMEKSEHHIPAIFHMEGLCGPFIQDSISYPSGIARGASWDLRNWKKKSEKAWDVRNLPAGSHESLHRYWIFQETPGWDVRAKHTERIPTLAPSNGNGIYERNPES